MAKLYINRLESQLWGQKHKSKILQVYFLLIAGIEKLVRYKVSTLKFQKLTLSAIFLCHHNGALKCPGGCSQEH